MSERLLEDPDQEVLSINALPQLTNEIQTNNISAGCLFVAVNVILSASYLQATSSHPLRCACLAAVIMG